MLYNIKNVCRFQLKDLKILNTELTWSYHFVHFEDPIKQSNLKEI